MLGQLFFEMNDWASFMGWLIVILLTSYFIRLTKREDPLYAYYLPHLFWKLILGISFGLVYILYYEGGDTIAYWAGAKTLNNLFWESPSAYFTELWRDTTDSGTPSYYTKTTGYPPGWIYREGASFFVSKLASILSFFSFGSYLTLNLYFIVISTWINWRFFIFIQKRLTKTPTRNVAIAILFIPTVGFWCSGIIKDTVVLCAILPLITVLFKLFSNNKEWNYKSFIVFIVSSYIVYATRSFMLISVYVPFMILFAFRYNSKRSFLIRLITRFFGISFSLAFVLVYINYSGFLDEISADNLLKTAQVIQQDFTSNKIYEGLTYDIGITDYSYLGMLKVLPTCVMFTLFRPFLWEFQGPLMLLNGIENFILLIMTLIALNNFRIRLLYKKFDALHEIFIFSLVFMLILGFFVGFTSGIYGVLARLKAPVLPFFLLFLFSQSERLVIDKKRHAKTNNN